MKDYYKILQVDPEADLAVLNQAYRVLVKQYHPDRYHTRRTQQMTEKMQVINEAYTTLSHAVTRAEYDARYNAWRAASSSQTASDSAFLGIGSVLQGSGGKLNGKKSSLKRAALWFFGVYLLGSLFLKPLLASPTVKTIFMVLILLTLYLIYGRRKPKG